MRTPAVLTNSSLLAALLAIALLPAGCSRAPQTGVLATVGDRQITTDDFKHEIARRHAAGRSVPDKAALLQEMVTFESLLQRARETGLTDDPQICHEINSLIVSRYQDRQLIPQMDAVVVSAEEIKAEYEKEIARYTQPEKVRLAMLVLRADPKASEETRASLRERLELARGKIVNDSQLTDFGALAIDCSDDQSSRYRGGDIGWLDAGHFASRWPRTVLEIGYALERKQVSPVIETPEGFYLVRKIDARPGHVTPLAEVDGQIKRTLTLKKRQQVEADFRLAAQHNAHAVINAVALAQVEVQLTPPSKSADAEPPALSMARGARRP